MKRYSFIYRYKNKRLVELIEYLERKYNLKYLETIDFHFPLSFSIFLIIFSPPYKEVMFKSNEEFDKIKKCKDCNFPIEPEDMLIENKNIQICRNCRRDIS